MNSKSMAGWVGFAGILMLIVGAVDFFQGLIALFDDEYFVVTQAGFLVVDLTGWGWIMLMACCCSRGLGLLTGQNWARWFGIAGQHAGAQLGDLLDRAAQLHAAVATQRAQQVAGEAFGMEPDQHRLGRVDLADHDGEMLLAAVARPPGEDAGVLGALRAAHAPAPPAAGCATAVSS